MPHPSEREGGKEESGDRALVPTPKYWVWPDLRFWIYSNAMPYLWCVRAWLENQYPSKFISNHILWLKKKNYRKLQYQLQVTSACSEGVTHAGLDVHTWVQKVPSALFSMAHMLEHLHMHLQVCNYCTEKTMVAEWRQQPVHAPIRLFDEHW